MSSPLVSAIIPVYNAADTVGAAIESVRRQTYANLEIVVVNDGSTDDTARVIREGYPEVIYHEQENSGPSVARNRAAEIASGEFLACLDSDDRWHPEKTERQLQIMLDDPTIGAVATNGWVHAGAYRYPWACPRKPRIMELTVRALLNGLRPISPSFMVRAEVFHAAGGYDPGIVFGEDLDLFCRVLGTGSPLTPNRFVFLNELLYIYASSPTSISAASFADLADDAVRVLEKLAPGAADAPGALTPAEHRWFMGERLTRAMAACVSEGRQEQAAEYLRRLEALEPLPLIYRLHGRAARLSPAALRVAVALHQAYLRVGRLYRSWGILGGAQQAWRTRLRRIPIP